MAKKPTTNDDLDGLYTTKGQPVYLERKGSWFWVVPQGNRSIYYGPYASRHVAEFYQEDVDTYRYDGGLEDE